MNEENTNTKINDQNDTAKKSPRRTALVLSIIALFLSISGIFLWLVTLTIMPDTDALNNRVNRLEYQLELIEKNPINLTVPNVQDIDNDYKVTIESVEQHLTGVRVKGRIINSTTLDNEDLSFKIKISNQSQDFYINRISAGNSTGFEVYVPNVPIDQTQYGEIIFVESIVFFNTK